MTGPEHYRRAENLLNDLRRAECRMSDRPSKDDAQRWLAEAQVHATLALAAATAINDAEGGLPVRDHEAWMAVAGTSKDVEIPSGGES